MTSAGRRRALLAFALMLGCSRPSPDLSLTVRQTAWPGRRTVEVVVRERQLEVTASAMSRVTDHRMIDVSEKQAGDLRRLFWRAQLHQPRTRHVQQIMDGILVEQVWQGPERGWNVSTRGPLTDQEAEAFVRLNALLPPQYRFPTHLGFDR